MDLQNWVRVNAAGSLKFAPEDSWRAYLAANGGTGKTIADMEMSFCIAAGATGKTLHDLWGSYLAGLGVAGAKARERARNRYK
jgi:RecA-family ATPase